MQAVIPKEKLLIYNVKQGWKPLCEFLGHVGCDAPEVEFSRENVSLSGTYRKIVAGFQRLKRDTFVVVAIFALLLAVFQYYFSKQFRD